jgi:hypothetical protein
MSKNASIGRAKITTRRHRLSPYPLKIRITTSNDSKTILSLNAGPEAAIQTASDLTSERDIRGSMDIFMLIPEFGGLGHRFLLKE